MDNFTIFTKTAKGLGEALGKTKNLSREQRKILKEIDGKASMGDLLAQLGMGEIKLQVAIGKLLAEDYIREFGSSAPPGAHVDGETVFGLTVPAKIEAANSQLTIGDFFRAMEQPQSQSQGASLNFKNLPSLDADAARKAREEEAAQVEQARRAIEEEARRITERAQQQAAEMARRQAEQEARQAAEQARLEAEAKARQEAELARQRAAEQARLQAEEQARLQEQARAKQEAEVKARREAEERARKEAAEAERQARIRAEQEARRLAEEAARRAAEEREREREKEREKELARKEAEELARRQAEELARKQAEEQARLKAEEEARLAAEARAREEVEELARVQAEQARLAAEARAREEAEAQARREVEEQARKIAEEQAQKAAQEQTRAKAWEAARRAAEELAQREAEAKAKAEAELQERLRAEEEARRAAEEQARRQAEEDARRQAEEQARRKAEEQARLQAEEQARLAAEEQARREAEAQAEREARERARQEAEEAARLKTEEKARQKAEAKARKEAEAQAKREAREQARREVEEKARLEAEQKAQQAAEAKARKEAEQQAKREAREKERQAAEEAARLKAEEAARAKAEKAASKAAQQAAASAAKDAAASAAEQLALQEAPEAMPEESTAPPVSDGGMRLALSVNFGKLVRLGALAMVVLAAAGLALLHVVPFNGRLTQLEQDAGAQFGQPVKIGALNLSLFPHPHWRLQQVAIGDQGQIAMPRVNAGVELGSLFSGTMQFKSMELVSPVVNDEGLGWILFGRSSNAAWQSASLSATDVRLRSRHMQLPAFDASAELDGESSWRKIMLRASAEKLHIDLQRAAGALRFELIANDIVLPFGGSLAFDTFNASGTVAPDALEIGKFTGVVHDGTVSGAGVLRWKDGWSLTGEAQARQLTPAKLAPALLQSGALDGSFKYAMQATEAGTLFASPQIRGSFSIGNGVLLGVDMASQVMGQAGSGKTSFNEISGDFTLAGGKLQLSRMRLTAGLLSAAGDAASDTDVDGKLSGRFMIDLRTASRQAHSSLNLAGTPAAPQFSR
ncbi:MAG TPA: hypothetical protein DHV59_14470 [Oxalobacteraceae bacterium]|nr:hypothetical protein [Oxalobacteraceae bacterium]